MKDEGKQASRAEESVKTCRDNNRGQHERDGSQRAQDGFAAEVKAGEEDGGWKAKQEGEESG